ncbi:MAG: flagellar biosynthetic protein FliR [Gallionellaceae bacterium]|nr:MAG: flagellar biosynthetic protein FliR [Gallionellaceae bacterium]
MISVTSAQLTAWIAAFIFPLARVLALIASAPILGNKQIPIRIKIGLAMLITFIVAPTINVPGGIDPASAQGLFILVQQILAGLAMGFAMRLIFTAVEMAGDLAGMQMGLGFASFYDPVNASYTPVIAQFLGVIAALAFLGFNGHLYMLAALADSFQAFPISTAPPSAAAFRTLAEWGTTIFTHALQLSMPLIGALMITNLALGILTRSAPQLNIFAVGFPITLTVGFAALALSLPYLAPMLDHVVNEGLDTMQRLALQMGKH